jgi:hypothetical protein
LNGTIEITPRGSVYKFTGEIVNETDFQFMFAYNSPLNKDNTVLDYIVCIANDGTKTIRKGDQVSYSITEYGLYGYAGLDENDNAFANIEVYVKNPEETSTAKISNGVNGDSIELGNDGNIRINSSDKVYINDVDILNKFDTVDAISLNGYSLWVGTTEELEQIEERDEKTLYFEIGEEADAERNESTVVLNNPVSNVLNLTTDKYQKVTSMQTDTTIVFPEVDPDKLIEIHLFFEAEEDINLIFPDDCKWRVDANIEEGKAYEIVMTYNTISWLADIIVYSN